MKFYSVFKPASHVLLLTVLVFARGESGAQVTVNKWHEGRTAAFSLTYDDGTKSHYTYLRPVLNKYNLKATFYLNTSLLSETPVPGAHSGSWEEFRTMYREGHEMGSHAVNHPDLTTLETGDSLTPNTMTFELFESRRMIEQKIGNAYKCITHAYPFCRNNTNVQEVTARYYQSARTCGALVNPSSPNYFAVSSQIFDWAATRNSFFDDFGQLNAFFSSMDNSVIASGKWGVLLCHEVLPFADLNTSGTWEPTTLEWMIEASKWLRQRSDMGQLWVATFADVTRYARERDAFYSAVIWADEQAISMLVADDLDNRIFDFPLTLDIVVPVDWKKVQLVQGNSIRNYKAEGTDPHLVRAQVVPLEDTIEIRRLPDDQLVLEYAELTAEGDQVLLYFSDKVKLGEVTAHGISGVLDTEDALDITGLSYAGSDSLVVSMGLGTIVNSGSLLSLHVENSEIVSTANSWLADVSLLPVRNHSRQLESEYQVLSVSSRLIERDEQAADVNIYVFSTSGFSLELESDWCSLSETSGTEYDTIQVHFESNLTAEARSDTIHLTSEEGFTEMIILNQAAAAVSVEENNIREGLFVYPSPATDYLNLRIPDGCALPATLHLLSGSGQQLRSMEIHEKFLSISVNDLSPGLYFVEVHSGGTRASDSFFVK